MFLKLLVKQVSLLLKKEKLSLFVIESCTGGMLSSLFTTYSGASEFFKGGIIAYSNQLKKDLLQVPAEILNKYGAVSKETAEILVKTGQDIAKSDLTIAITGIAGPKSDNSKKPLGLVYIAINYKEEIMIKEYYLNSFSLLNKRNFIQKRACKEALLLLTTYKGLVSK